MFKKKYICIASIGIVIIMIISSYLFQTTKGLLYVMGIKESKVVLKYTSELLSSGGYDNLVIGAFDIF